MGAPRPFYCLTCGLGGDATRRFCERCGALREATVAARRSGVAFVLNELRAYPLAQVLTPQQRARVESHYEAELELFAGGAPARTSTPQDAHPSQPTPVSRPVSAPPPIARPQFTPPPPPQQRHPQPRREFDWSWIAEQQANLFLFAGAFLTVIAALIYVGYSGNAIADGLKMAMLSTYTLAFLAGGAICTRIKRVKMAGNVFFAVGAIFVPLNFVAARTIFGDEQFSTETMWLMGSIATGAFYTAIAYIGLGRVYAFAAGAALASATLALVVVAEVPVEWAPAFFVAVAMAMSLTSIAGPARLRERIGTIWRLQAHAVAASSAVATIITALYSADADTTRELSSPWFLPLTLAGLAVYGGVQTLATRETSAAVATIAGFGGAFVAVVFATDAPVEYYAVIFGALAVTFGGAMMAAEGSGADVQARLPKQFDEMLRIAGMVATGAALLVGFLVLQATEDAPQDITLQTRWFVAMTFGLMLPFYAVDAYVRRERTGVWGFASAVVGTAAGVVFGFDLSAEYYAFAFVLPAVVLGAAARWAQHAKLAPLATPWRDDVFVLGYIAVFIGLVVAAGCVLAGLDAQDSTDALKYEPEFRAFLPLVLAGALAFAAIDLSRGERLGVVASSSLTVTLGAGIVYALNTSGELYAFGLAGGAFALALIARFAPNPRRFSIDASWRTDAFGAGRIGMLLALTIAIGAVALEADTSNTYEVVTRWFLPIAFAAASAFFALDASRGERFGALLTAVVVISFGGAVVYALDIGTEHYTFGLIAPALVLAVAARFSPDPRGFTLDALWRQDAFNVGRTAVAAGALVALSAVVVDNDAVFTSELTTRWFLAIASALVVVFAALDASRGRRTETSAALYVAITATGWSVMYGLESDASYYGATLVGVAIAIAFAGRVWSPAWVDGRTRDVLAAVSVTGAWLLFDAAYRDVPRIGGSVYLSAAFFYAMAAITDRSSVTLQRFIDTPQLASVKVASGWLYASGFTAAVAFIYMLVALPEGESAFGLPLSNTFALVAFAFAAVGVATKRWRPDFRAHLYVMSLAAAIVALAAGPSAGLLTLALVAYVVLYLALALLEDQPLIAVPSAVFGFAAVAAWREHAHATWSTIPAAYSAIAIIAAAICVVIADRKRWLYGIGGAAGVYAVAAPIVGFMLLAGQIDDVTGLLDGQRFYKTDLYQVSTLSVAIAGALGLAAAYALRKRWVIVPASGVLLIAALLAIGYFNPENPQAYSAVAGAYLVGLGLLGLWRFKLIPELAEAAPFVEALGAAIIMLPSFVQSLDAGYRYQWILLAEALGFLTLSIVLRRRGMLAAALSAMVLVAGRMLVDAVNALPSWVIVAIAGSALLGIGMGILLGRDRWSAWQAALMGWWDENGNGHSPA